MVCLCPVGVRLVRSPSLLLTEKMRLFPFFFFEDFEQFSVSFLLDKLWAIV